MSTRDEDSTDLTEEQEQEQQEAMWKKIHEEQVYKDYLDGFTCAITHSPTSLSPCNDTAGGPCDGETLEHHAAHALGAQDGTPDSNLLGPNDFREQLKRLLGE